MTMEHCVEIVNAIAPVCEQLTANGAINWLNKQIEQSKVNNFQ